MSSIRSNVDFHKLWAGQTISELGSRLTRDALPLTALLVLGASEAQMGLLSAAGSLPVLAFGLFAGAWVDRLHRRPVMILADLARALILATLPLAFVLGQLTMPHLYVVILLVGLLTMFFDVAYRSYLPSLVARENIVEGNSRLELSSASAEVVGPGLAGVLVQTVGGPFAILLDAISFLFSALMVGWIRKPEAAVEPVEAGGSTLREIGAGLGFVFRQPLLRAFTLASATSSFFGNFIGVLYGLFAIRDLGLGPAALGFTIAAGGLGDLGGALFAGRFSRWLGVGRTILSATLVKSLLVLLIPLAGWVHPGPESGSPATLFLAVGFLLAGQLFGDGLRTISTINEISLRQAITPDRMLGRMNASIEFMLAGIGPLGAIAGGFLGQYLGARQTLLIAALGILLSVLWLVFSPLYRVQEIPAEPAR